MKCNICGKELTTGGCPDWVQHTWPDKPVFNEMSDIIEQKDTEIERLNNEVENEKGRANYNYKNYCKADKEIAALQAQIKEMQEMIAHLLTFVLDPPERRKLLDWLDGRK